MKLAKCITFAGLLAASSCFAQYTSPLTDQAYYTEALWAMESIDGGGRVADENTNNAWRHNDLVTVSCAALPSGNPGFGNSLRLNGVSSYGKSRYPWQKHRNGVLIEAWVWINPDNTGTNNIVFTWDVWRVFTDNSGNRLNFRVFAPDNSTNQLLSVAIAPGTWQHIRAEFNEGSMSLAVLGGASANTTASFKKMNRSLGTGRDGYVFVGAKGGVSEFFHGEVDDLRITSPTVSSAVDRAKDILECVYWDNKVPSPANDASAVVAWSEAVLYLGSQATNDITAGDVTSANSKLESLTNPALFEQLPVTPPADDSPDAYVYWALPSLARIVNDPIIATRLTSPARTQVTNILTNYVRERDLAPTLADLTEGAVWTVDKSMNHDWLRKATYLLTAQYCMNNGINPNYADGQTATQHYNAWVAHLKAKFRQMASRGIDPEIGNQIYIQVSLDAIFAIRDYCDDGSLAGMAEDFINLYLADAAAESFHGVRGGSKTRSYTDYNSYDADYDNFGLFTHLLVNDPAIRPEGDFHIGTASSRYIDRHNVGLAMSVIGGYAAPTVLQNLMLNVANKNFAHTSRRPAKGFHDDATQTNKNPIYHYQFLSDIRRYTTGNSKYILGSHGIKDNVAITYYTQLTRIDHWMGLITSGWRYSRIYFQAGPGGGVGVHNGLNAVQGGGAMLIKRAENTPNDPYLFCSLSDDFTFNKEATLLNGWLFTQNYNKDVFVAIKPSSGNMTITTSADAHGHGTNTRVQFSDTNAIVAMEVSDSGNPLTGNFTQFKTLVQPRNFSGSGNVTYVSSSATGNRTLMMNTSGGTSTIDGGAYGGTNISKTYNGEYLTHGTYDDPAITVRDTALTDLSLNFGYTPYTIDPDWVTLKYDDFQGGMGNYTDNGANCSLYSQTVTPPTVALFAHQGTEVTPVTNPRTFDYKGVDLESNSSSASFTLTSGLNLNTPGYTQLKVEFWYMTDNMAGSDNFKLEFANNGSTFTTAATYTFGTNFQNQQFRYGCVVLNESSYGSFGSGAKIRFKCYSSSTSHDVVIDQVRISARVK